MVVIDGSKQSGSGTIVRYAVALAALLREPVRVINVRHSRTQPGLRPQRVASVRACAQLSGAVTDGVQARFAVLPNRRHVPRYRPPASNLPGVVGSSAAQVVAAIPLKPATWILRVDPSAATP